MKAKTEKNLRTVELVYDYSHNPTLRRSGMTKAGWEYVVHKFGITYSPEAVASITITGEDDYGHLLLSIVVEE